MLRRMYVEQERRAGLFHEMMARYSYDQHPDLAKRSWILAEGMLRCQACNATRRCEAWLGDVHNRMGAEAFCPNVAAFGGFIATAQSAENTSASDPYSV